MPRFALPLLLCLLLKYIIYKTLCLDVSWIEQCLHLKNSTLTYILCMTLVELYIYICSNFSAISTYFRQENFI